MRTKKKPLVSIILPTLNGEKWIEQSISSALNQTYKEIEVIVVDNGSQDRTLEIVDGIRRKDSRVKILFCEKKGVPCARNFGIKNSEGDYISFLDQDDIYLPFKTEVQVEFMEKNPVFGLCYGGVIVSDMRRTSEDYPPVSFSFTSAQISLLADNIFASCSFLARRDVFEVVGLLDEDLNKADDYDFICRVVKFFPIYVFPASFVYVYRNHVGQASFSGADIYRWACDYAALKHFWSMEDKIWGKDKDEIAKNMWRIANKIFWEAQSRVREGLHFPRFDTLLEIMKTSLELSPSPHKERKIQKIEEMINSMTHFRFSPYKPEAELIRLSEKDKEEVRRKAQDIKAKLSEFRRKRYYFHDILLKRKFYVDVNQKPKISLIYVGEDDPATLASIKQLNYPINIKKVGFELKRSDVDGDFVGFIFSGDTLRQEAFGEVVKAINDGAEFIYTDEGYMYNRFPALKPDFSPHTLEFFNYISQFSLIKKGILPGKIRFREMWFWETIRECVGKAKKITHIRKVLYMNKDRAMWEKESQQGNIEQKRQFSEKNPLISIVVVPKFGVFNSASCIRSIVKNSSYRNFEIIIFGEDEKELSDINQSSEISISFLKIQNLISDYSFILPRILNYGTRSSKGDFLVFLDSDLIVDTSEWLENLLFFAEEEDIACVGGVIQYPSIGYYIGVAMTGDYDTIYAPEEVILSEDTEYKYFNLMKYPRNVSSVSAKFMMVKREVFEKLGGFDERYSFFYYDSDFCLRAINMGYFNLITPYVRAKNNNPMEEKKDEYVFQWAYDLRLFISTHREFLETPDPFTSDFFYIRHKIEKLKDWYSGEN